ncbi:FRG domain-containing protein [Shewanella sp. AS16]|uniref:FRG domain-containing protein n=1 Tax=Shewanella sp. AS16 TaxID=2907625 RepID=UPI003FA3B730
MLVIGQHQGLATGLLDWSYSPLTAAYFSSFNYSGADAALFSFQRRCIVATRLAVIADVSLG